MIFRSALPIKSFFFYKDTINRSRQKLFLRLVVGSARIFTLDKQNVDCMTEKLNILKGSRVPVMHLLSQTTSRQLEHVTLAGRQSELKKQTKQTKGKIMPFETTYHPGVKTIKPILMQKMESHPKLATAENNLWNSSNYNVMQKRKIAQRHACQSKTLKARQSKTLNARVPLPQNQTGESVLACL